MGVVRDRFVDELKTDSSSCNLKLIDDHDDFIHDENVQTFLLRKITMTREQKQKKYGKT